MGEIIGMPFIFWILWTSFEFGNNDQFFAILGLIGLGLMFTKYHNLRIIKILSFILMLTPIFRRFSEIPIEKFNYLAFKIPFGIFIITYLLLIFKQSFLKKE